MLRRLSALASLLALLALALPARSMPQQRRCLFDAPLIVADQNACIRHTCDLDGDGYADAVGWWTHTHEGNNIKGNLQGWINDGNGKLTLAWQVPYILPYPGPTYATHEVVADLNGDGRDDYVVSIAQTTFLMLSNGSAAPTVQSPWSLYVEGLCTADFTGDGRADLAVLSSGSIKIYTYDTTLNSMSLISSYDCACAADELLTVECNGDGQRDIMAVWGWGMRLFSVLNGQLQSAPFYSPGFTGAMTAVGDVDGDGDDDIVFFGMTQYQVLRRTGPATFNLEPLRTGGPATNLVDVDGDGDLDGVCCGGGGTPSGDPNATLSIFRVSFNDGTGAFAPAIEIPGLGSLHIAGVADLEHDGDMDLVAGRCVYYPHGSITADVMPSVGATARDQTCVVDFDGDHDPDFATGFASGTRNLGDGSVDSFTPPFAPPPTGYAFTGPGIPADFDGDGDTDLVVKISGSGNFGSMELFLNNGGGGFVDAGIVTPPGIVFNASTLPAYRLVADVDGDGDLDIITRITPTPLKSQIWLNDGTAHFGLGATIDYEFVEFVGDMNGDSVPDLVSSGWAAGVSGNIKVLAGLGGGAFGPSVPIGGMILPGTDRFAVADVDADGDLDIATIGNGDYTTYNDFNGYVYVNNGTGHFVPALLPGQFDSSTNAPKSVSAFDVDGDGRIDLVLGPVLDAQSAVSILARKADNSGWQTPVQQTMFRFEPPYNALIDQYATADVDGDGDTDIVAERIVRNRTFNRAESGARRQGVDGTAGAGGMTPTLGASGPFRAGNLVQLHLTGACPTTNGRLIATLDTDIVLFPTLGQHPARAHRLARLVPIVTSAGNGASGSGTWSLAFNADTSLAGRTMRYEVELDDPAAVGGVARSNTLELVFGP